MMIQEINISVRNMRILPLTAKEFLCGAIGLSVGNAMNKDISMESLMQVLYKVAERYMISKEELKEMMDELDAEFGKDAKVQDE